MPWLLYSVMFVVSIWFMHLSSGWVIGSLMRLSKALGIREFVVGFFVMATASSLPNLFVGITSATSGVPELSLGDVFGNNLVAMTLAVIIAIIFAPQKEIETGGKTIQTTALFTMGAAILPIVLMHDGTLSEIDGLMLIGLFFCYLYWLFVQQGLFSKVYNNDEKISSGKKLRRSFKDIFKVLTGICLLVIASFGIVNSAEFFALKLGIPILLVGLLVTGLGNALPEIYFAVASSKRRETQMIVGNLMGSVIFPATLVLGIVSIIHPINVQNFQFAASSRIFLLISAVLFYAFTRSKGKISLPEGAILLAIYAGFVGTVISNL